MKTNGESWQPEVVPIFRKSSGIAVFVLQQDIREGKRAKVAADVSQLLKSEAPFF